MVRPSKLHGSCHSFYQQILVFVASFFSTSQESDVEIFFPHYSPQAQCTAGDLIPWHNSDPGSMDSDVNMLYQEVSIYIFKTCQKQNWYNLSLKDTFEFATKIFKACPNLFCLYFILIGVNSVKILNSYKSLIWCDFIIHSYSLFIDSSVSLSTFHLSHPQWWEVK